MRSNTSSGTVSTSLSRPIDVRIERGGVAVQEVEPAVGLERDADELGDRRLVGDVERDVDRTAAGVVDPGGDRAGGVAVEVADHHRRSLLGETDRRRRADPSRPARHDRNLVRETTHRGNVTTPATGVSKPAHGWSVDAGSLVGRGSEGDW